MAFLASTVAISLRFPIYLATYPRRHSMLPTAVNATASTNSNSTSPRPILFCLRLSASAAVLLAATSPAIATTPSRGPPTPPPAALTVTLSPDEILHVTFEKLIGTTVLFVRLGDADTERAILSSTTSGAGESYARLLAALALFVDGKADEAIVAFKKLAREDPGDYRPLFCQIVLYFSLGRAEESISALMRCRKVAGNKFDPDFASIFSEAEAAAMPWRNVEEGKEGGGGEVSNL